MPDFTYDGDEGRFYPSLPAPANAPEPGETYELDSDPGDGRWKAKKTTRKTTDEEKS